MARSQLRRKRMKKGGGAINTTEVHLLHDFIAKNGRVVRCNNTAWPKHFDSCNACTRSSAFDCVQDCEMWMEVPYCGL